MTKLIILLLWCIPLFVFGQTETGVYFCKPPALHHRSMNFQVCHNNTNDKKYGICWNTSPNPTIFDAFHLFADRLSSEKLVVKSLAPQTTYYFRFFELLPNGSALYEDDFVFETKPELKIGDNYQGGFVAYIFKPNDSLYVENEQHGLILAKVDLGAAFWGIMGEEVNPRTSTLLGQGMANTQKIIAFMVEKNYAMQQNTTTDLKIIYPCAAWLCSQFEYQGYRDWFLPSKDEWGVMFDQLEYLQHANIKFQQPYWTSSEVFVSFKFDKTKRKETKTQHRNAWQTDIRGISLITFPFGRKNAAALVRAMRYF